MNNSFDSETNSLSSGEIHSDCSILYSGDVKNRAPGASPSSLCLDSSTTCDIQQDIQPISVPSANENDSKDKGNFPRVYLYFKKLISF